MDKQKNYFNLHLISGIRFEFLGKCFRIYACSEVVADIFQERYLLVARSIAKEKELSSIEVFVSNNSVALYTYPVNPIDIYSD